MTDLFLALFIAGYVFGGSRTGLLRRLAGLAFIAIGLIAGAYLRVPVGAILAGFFEEISPDYADMVGYAVTFAVIVTALNLVSGPVLSRATVGGFSPPNGRHSMTLARLFTVRRACSTSQARTRCTSSRPT